eukprot:TRINITY_DN12135_c0_g3_i1.p1 TRINITY_DN12135_c0_g3~~TRINITY_DN12135_c0_g3_i1.p1  ORF type:complete len:414 (-),score=9.59 TRINITY_DN12135_c0_g3_i1:419-1660(-)
MHGNTIKTHTNCEYFEFETSNSPFDFALLDILKSVFMLEIEEVLLATGKFYDLERIIRGGQSFIIFAKHVEYGPVAVKVIETINAVGRVTWRLTDQQLGILLQKKPKWTARELLNMLRVHDHQGIVTVHMAFFKGPPYHLDRYFFIVMERADNDLNQYILQERPHGVTEQEARAILQQLVNALCFMHSKGVVHRDIKAGNCLHFRSSQGILEYDRFKITDFGFSKSYFSSRPYSKVGTRSYSAPELLTSDTTFYDGYKVDVWSLGVVLYFLLFGNCPFGDETIPLTQLNDNILNLDLTNNLDWSVFLGAISSSCKDLLQKMLQKQPALRIDMTGVRNHEWITQNFSSSVVHHMERFNAPPPEDVVDLDNPLYYWSFENILKGKVQQNLVQDEITIQFRQYIPPEVQGIQQAFQ